MEETASAPKLSKRARTIWSRFTQESNKRFAKMSPRQKRVAIAEDVIAQIKVKALIPEHGTYAVSKSERIVPRELDGLDMQVAIPYMENCNVCAVGSVMVCTIMRSNNVEYHDDGGSIDDQANPHRVAKRFFTGRQTADMEDIFEHFEDAAPRVPGATSDGFSPVPRVSWWPQNLEAEDILTLIMKHVIDSGGRFSRGSFVAWMKKKYDKTPAKRRATRRGETVDQT